MGDGPRLPFSCFLVCCFHMPQWEQRRKKDFWGRKKKHTRNTIVKPQQLAGSQTVNPKPSFCVCSFKLTGLQVE